MRLPRSAPGEVRLGDRRVGAGDQQALAPCRARSTSIACSIRPVPPVSTTAASVGGSVGRRRLAEREGEQDEAERVEQQQERAEARDHSASRNAASTAVRATQVASAVSASGSKASSTRSARRQRRAAGQLAGEGGAAGEQQQDERRRDARRPTLPTKRIDRDLALEQVRDLHVGRADPVHHLDGEAVGVERAARGEHDRRRRRRRSAAAPAPNATHCSSAQRAQQRPDAFAMGDDPRAGATACDALLRSPRGRRRAATSKLISAGTGKSAALRRPGPSQRSSVRRMSLSGTASATVTPGAERTALQHSGRRRRRRRASRPSSAPRSPR